MNWLNGLIVIWQLHGYGFKPWRTYIKLYIFGIFGFDVNMERWEGNLSEWAAKGGWKGSHREGLNGTLCLIQCQFRFGN